jgi:hypothetical protein
MKQSQHIPHHGILHFVTSSKWVAAATLSIQSRIKTSKMNGTSQLIYVEVL